MDFPRVPYDMTQHYSRLLIVYNADGGILNALKDMVHKIVSPSTYPCSLCALTHGAFSMHGQWRRFLGTLRMDVQYYHRDEFAKAYPTHTADLPAILLAEHGNPARILISADELNAMDDLPDLIVRVESRLEIERIRNPFPRAVA
ncbi:phage holin family protein [Erythrobacter ani]|uniref:GTPase n=1 Tax=Erythrobacter ani TaxID=2827235 RepID=A0ABS6SNU9_9SPHN|nr:phage holin family protein [Erythrobacter ani]MBV7266108.1 hypothetical protein [Erythrobacter ani]